MDMLLITLLGLGAIYLTGRGIQGSRYGFGRFLLDLGIASLVILVIFGFAWILGGSK